MFNQELWALFFSQLRGIFTALADYILALNLFLSGH